MSNQPDARRLADALDECKYVDVYRCKQAAAQLRRLPEIEAQRDEARRTARQAHEMGTRVVAQRDALLAVLEDIAGTDPVDAALDPQRAVRIARAAIKAVEEQK